MWGDGTAVRVFTYVDDLVEGIYLLMHSDLEGPVNLGADALLFVRGHISGRRSSAIAGIACGLPVVAYEGVETGFPITEAGVWLAPQGDLEALSEGLCRVLTDESLWQALHQRSVQAYRRYFSWDAIANQFLKVLGNEVTHDGRT